MKQSIPKITRLDKPAMPDSFGIANSPIGFILIAWHKALVIRIAILPADAEKQLEYVLEDYDWDIQLPRDDIRARTFTDRVLFPQNQWTGYFPEDAGIGFFGSDFQWAVMNTMNAITAGKTLSYATLAKSAGQGEASRAAGSVCARNPLPLIVPCHRVVKSDGTLGHYGYGTGLKRQLLHWENGQGF